MEEVEMFRFFMISATSGFFFALSAVFALDSRLSISLLALLAVLLLMWVAYDEVKELRHLLKLTTEDLMWAAEQALAKAATTDLEQFPPGAGDRIHRNLHARRKRFLAAAGD
jgi:hypothetical protein